MKLSVTGVNHRTAPVEVRERLNFSESELPGALSRLRSWGASEGMILSTCNRVEVTLVTPDSEPARELAKRFLSESRCVPADELDGCLYHFEGPEAVRHLFRVASGLDSMVVGEPQILGQMKAAFAQAKGCGAVGGLLEQVLTQAFRVAKRIRTETGIGRNPVSVSYVAVQLARQIFGDLSQCAVLLVGAGKMAELAATHFQGAGVRKIWVTNRTAERAQQLTERFQAGFVAFDQFRKLLGNVDIVLVSTGAQEYVLRPADFRKALEERRQRPIFVIDISVPRNVDPNVNLLEGVFLYDIDDLQAVVQENLRSRLQEAQQAEQIVEQEVARVMGRLQAREITPTVVALQRRLEELRQAELARVKGKLAQLPVEYQELIDAVTRGLVNKIAHQPLTEIRRMASEPDGEQALRVARRLFGLEDSV